MKVCVKCGQMKMETEFILRNKKLSLTDRAARCNACALIYTRSYNAKNKATLNAAATEKRKQDPAPSLAAAKKWRDANPEKRRTYQENNRPLVRAAGRERYRKDPEKYCLKRREQLRNNPERCRATAKKWRLAHPDNVKAAKARRRAKERGSAGDASTKEIQARIAYFGKKCAYCGGPFEHLDHFVPLTKGGSGHASNLVPACAACNLSKSNKNPGEWTMKKLGQGVLFL